MTLRIFVVGSEGQKRGESERFVRDLYKRSGFPKVEKFGKELTEKYIGLRRKWGNGKPDLVVFDSSPRKGYQPTHHFVEVKGGSTWPTKDQVNWIIKHNLDGITDIVFLDKRAPSGKIVLKLEYELKGIHIAYDSSFSSGFR